MTNKHTYKLLELLIALRIHNASALWAQLKTDEITNVVNSINTNIAKFTK